MPLTLRSAAGSDVGQRRALNQDSAITSSRLLAVADGMGGHAHGEVASSVAVQALADLDAGLAGKDLSQFDLLASLEQAAATAVDRLTALAREDSALRGSGTTVVALLFDGARTGILHVGDSRAYLVRDGELHRLTRDHTLVQALVDEGRLTPQEAAEHPRRSMLLRTLQDDTVVEPDLFHHDGHAGDRYLVCSDGVTAVLDDTVIAQVLGDVVEPAAVVERLIELANEGGGPDNITCVVADLLDEPEASADDDAVLFGAAAGPAD